MTSTLNRFEAALDAFDSTVHPVTTEQLTDRTPCEEWDVRALLNHVVGEAAWMSPLLAGRTIAEVGDELTGDLLGTDPCAAWHHWSGAAHTAAAEAGAMNRTVHLSYGDEKSESYCEQVTFDLLVHSWDLARATGRVDRLPVELVAWAREWVAPVIAMYQQAGIVAAPLQVAPDADPQTQLLALVGRSADWA